MSISNRTWRQRSIVTPNSRQISKWTRAESMFYVRVERGHGGSLGMMFGAWFFRKWCFEGHHKNSPSKDHLSMYAPLKDCSSGDSPLLDYVLGNDPLGDSSLSNEYSFHFWQSFGWQSFKRCFGVWSFVGWSLRHTSFRYGPLGESPLKMVFWEQFF